MAPTDPSPSAPDGNGSGVVSPAETMVRELTDMLASWESQALALADQGIDPRPLLRALAANLRSVAEQLEGGLAQPDDD
jgi:hypothetical protein